MNNAEIALEKIRNIIDHFVSDDIRVYLKMLFGKYSYLISSGLIHEAPSFVQGNPKETLLEAIYNYVIDNPGPDEEAKAGRMVRYIGFALTNKTTNVLTDKGQYIDHLTASYGISVQAFIAAEGVLGREIPELLKNRINCRILYDREKFSNK